MLIILFFSKREKFRVGLKCMPSPSPQLLIFEASCRVSEGWEPGKPPGTEHGVGTAERMSE